MSLNVGSVTRAAADELRKLLKKYPKRHPPHYYMGVLFEEVDELKAEVWKRDAKPEADAERGRAGGGDGDAVRAGVLR